MNDVRERFISGNRFSEAVARAGVPAADQVAPAPAEAKPSLPDDTISILMALTPKTEDEKQERKNLISERFDLNARTLEFVMRQASATRADLEQKHEEAKLAVVKQGAVLENLKTKLTEDTQDFLRKHNAYVQSQTVARDAEQQLKTLSRFSSKKQIAEAEERAQLATKRMGEAQASMASAGQSRNYFQTVTIPQENKKLAELIEKEIGLAAQLEGRDPVLARFGFMQA